MYKLSLTIKARSKSEKLLRDLKRAIHDLTERFALAGAMANEGLESLAFLGKPELEVLVETPPARVYTADVTLPGRDWIHYEVERVEDVLAGSAEVVSYVKGHPVPLTWFPSRVTLAHADRAALAEAVLKLLDINIRELK